MSEDKVRERLEQLKAVAGLKGRDAIKPHSLRHFFAKHMESQGADLETIQHALGHETLETTLIYLRRGDKNTQKMKRFASLPCAELPNSQPAPEPLSFAESEPDAPVAAPVAAAVAAPVTTQTAISVAAESTIAALSNSDRQLESPGITPNLERMSPVKEAAPVTLSPLATDCHGAQSQVPYGADHPEPYQAREHRRADPHPQHNHWANRRSAVRRGIRTR